MRQKTKKLKQLALFTAGLACLAILGLSGGKAHAATVPVSGTCPLADAITSVNNGADENTCTSSGAYGANDTISIPAGTQTLTANLPNITVPVTINGAGVDQTTIDGDNGQYRPFKGINVGGLVSISNLKVTAYNSAAIDIEATDSDISITNIEVDGNDAQGGGIYINLSGTQPTAFTSSGVYVHDINWSGEDIYAFAIGKHGTTTAIVNIDNTTIANITTTGSNQLYGFGLTAGTGGDGTGTMTANITNTTIDHLSGENFVAPFYALAFGPNGNTTVTTNVTYVTITDTAGSTGTIASSTLTTAAFYAIAAGAQTGNVGTATINVENSLFANNKVDGTSNNCGSIDLTADIGGQGSGVASINSLGHNLSDDASCSGFNQTGDQQNKSNIISTLEALKDNGGEVPTRALLAGSPAIAAGGQVLGISTDARGVARPTSNPSSGAYQYVAGASTTTSGGSLVKTGQVSPTSILVGIFLVSSTLALIVSRRNTSVKR